MSHFVSKEPVKIYLDDNSDEWIAVKPKLSLGERNLLTGSMMAVDQKTREMGMKMDRYLQMILDMSIVDWRLLDGDGEPIPFSKSLIVDLDPDDPLVDKVLEKIGELNPTLGGKATTTSD